MAKTKAAKLVPSNVTSISAGRKPRAAAAEVSADAGDAVISDAAPAVIVFGKDESGKAHASWFAGADAELAIKAAGLMGFSALRVTSPDMAASALELAQGPRLRKRQGFRAFLQDAGVRGACPPSRGPSRHPRRLSLSLSRRLPSPARRSVGKISLSAALCSLRWVLTKGGSRRLVTEARGASLFVLRWQGWPEDAAFVRRADGLALLPERPVEASAAG